jgi:mono/diheme cytochrome c family protein
LAILLAAGASIFQTRAEAPEVSARGRSILADNCARCHAISDEAASPHKEAPPFRDVVKRYPPETLEEALGEGLSTGHPDMPEFMFEPDDIAAIVSYLRSLLPAAQ